MAAYTKQTWDTTSIFNPTRMNYIEQGIYNASTNIVDNLTSTDATSALSAKQGKALNDKVSGLIKTKTVSITTSSQGIANLNTTDSQEHILSIYVQDRLALHFWVGSGHANWIKLLKWDTLTPLEETVSVTYSYI